MTASTTGTAEADLLRMLVEDDRLARAAWSRLAEPGEAEATALVARCGAGPALGVVASGRDAKHAGYRARLMALDPRPELDLLARLGGRLVCPDDPEWPAGLDALSEPPFCLRVRGPLDLAAACRRSVAIVGSRAATAYGTDTAGVLAEGVAERGFTVVSGAAFGIDAAAQWAVLHADGATVSVLAGGVDRAYPRANEGLLTEVVRHGAVVAEVPLGSAPTKLRFIRRNRMIATMTTGTVVVEAALRSGALNTARTAADHGRPVGVVPGPVTSPVSAGCHQALRDGYATVVTEPAEIVELVGRIGEDVTVRPTGPRRPDWDDLDEVARRVLDALPTSNGSPAEKLALVSGIDVDGTRAALGRLSLLGLAERHGPGWRLVPRSRRRSSG
jgi:DNA processing protein